MPEFVVKRWNWWGAAADLARPAGTRIDKTRETQAGGKSVPGIQRRRLGFAGRGLADALAGLGNDDGASNIFDDCNEVVFASRYADTTRSQRLLEQITAESAVSPADFSMAVHNALPGLLTLVAKSRIPYTSVTGGVDTIAMGLLDSIARLHRLQDGKILFLYVDQALPDIWAEFDGNEAAPVALAIVISCETDTGLPRYALNQVPADPESAPQSCSAQSKAYDLIAVLSGEQPDGCLLSPTWNLESVR